MDEAVDTAYARCYCPAVIFLLSQLELLQGLAIPDSDLLLDVVEKAEEQDASMIPPLLALIKKRGDDLVGTHARRLLAAFRPEAIEPYRVWAKPERRLSSLQ